jgi:hypothetical protein
MLEKISAWLILQNDQLSALKKDIFVYNTNGRLSFDFRLSKEAAWF